MASEYTSESPEQIEVRRRKATASRIKILSVIGVVAIGARLLLSDPERKPPPDYTKMPIKIVPGMLDTLPAATRAKLDPQVVAKMVLVDEQARRGEYGKPAPAVSTGTYKAPVEMAQPDLEAETYKQQMYAYAKRRRIETEREARREEEQRDLSKTTLVQFSSGGYLHAETAERVDGKTDIRVSRAMLASVPSGWVSAIQKDAVDWKDPVPAGRVRLKPAKGITVILDDEAARRVTVEKSKTDEI